VTGHEPSNRQNSNTVENRGSGEDGALRPEDIEVEGKQTDLQKWLGLREYGQVISQCLAVCVRGHLGLCLVSSEGLFY